MSELGLELLRRANIILSSATVLIAFSLLAYLFVYNFRSPVARTFVAVLSLVTIVYVGDVFLATARLTPNDPAAAFWLGFEWIGIALVVPAYLHFSDNVLATVGNRSSRRRAGVAAAYLAGLAALTGVYASDLVTGDIVGAHGAVHFVAGPLFLPFAVAYLAGTAWAARNLWLARRSALTLHTRRRMGYMTISIIAPLSVFPYLTAVGASVAESPLAFRMLSAVASAAVATMLVVTAYGVAYQGALIPDRAVKRDMIKYLIQVPTLGVFVIATMEMMPRRLESSLGLPRDVVLALAVVVGIVVFQFVMRAAKPLVDNLTYGAENGRDGAWLRRLDERLMTDYDLQQLLENILAAMCDQLRIRHGCMIAARGGRPQLEAYAGERQQSLQLLERLDVSELAALGRHRGFAPVDGYWVHPLHSPDGRAVVGILALDDPGRPLTESEEKTFGGMIRQAEIALEDRLVEQRVLDSLRALEPELAGLQRLRGALEPGTGAALAAAQANPIDDPDFPHWVKDALAHYWGGPKLTESPLIGLRVVRKALDDNDQNAARAMRSVLDDALERLRPEGERSLTAREWLLYNILELRFVKGMKVRDISQRLAMSESDLYRKQRTAIEALARQLAALEAEPTSEESDRS